MLGSFLDDLVERAVRSLESSGVTFALTGGMALIACGRDRTTRDIDVVASLTEQQMELLRNACRNHGFEHDETRDTLVLEGVTILRFWIDVEAIDLRLGLDVQVGKSAFYAKVLERARPLMLAGHSVPVASVEDLLLLKLVAFRPIDRADCIHLVRLGSHLDQDYLKSWVKRLGLESRWKEVVEAAD